MPICVLKRGDLSDRMPSRENEARFLHQNEVNGATEKQNGRMQLHRQPNANTKLDLRSPIVDRDKKIPSVGGGGYGYLLVLHKEVQKRNNLFSHSKRTWADKSNLSLLLITGSLRTTRR